MFWNWHEPPTYSVLYSELDHRTAEVGRISTEVFSSPWAQLPTEIVQQIMSHLAPADFNSARHACRSWFVNCLGHVSGLFKRYIFTIFQEYPLLG